MEIPTQAKTWLEWATHGKTRSHGNVKNPHFWQSRPEMGHPGADAGATVRVTTVISTAQKFIHS
jgi:hypothetical protein